MYRKFILILLALLFLFTIAGCECLWAWTGIYVNRNVPAAQQDFLLVKDIYICAGESVLLQWDSNPRLTQVQISQEIGEVDNSGHTVVSPSHTTEYVITAEGEDCRSTSRARVYVVGPGDEVRLTAHEISDEQFGDYHWRVKTKEQIYSPDIIVNSIRAGLDTNKVAPWIVNVKDSSGIVHEFEIPEDRWTTPDPRFSIIGQWDFWPDKNYEGEANFFLQMECQ